MKGKGRNGRERGRGDEREGGKKRGCEKCAA